MIETTKTYRRDLAAGTFVRLEVTYDDTASTPTYIGYRDADGDLTELNLHPLDLTSLLDMLSHAPAAKGTRCVV
ncbi:hypothetical protein GCM10010218_48340 [Streptomyces mashuensis]|uniref:Uncharacterized protein n=1 Tax=Streptomyces mashuensis TaxID=33904 RepID=A0A919EE37_9ACTN|nr:hypothetical protein [Streptomyces mashuensis]GHF61137.1 hypothetical protein GCM10010218_48340 [Streptomyces mashuensis]